MAEVLTESQIAALAEVFSDPYQASHLLERAGLPRSLLPGWASGTPSAFWYEVARMLENGVIVDGVSQVLQAARTMYPANPMFAERSTSAPGVESTPDRAQAEEGWDFFISYAEADRKWAEWIAWTLEEAGYTVLVQAWDLVPGSNWISAMDGGLRHARRIIVVLSDTYLGSVFGQAEWQAAFRADPRGMARKLIPVRISPTQASGLLGSIVGIDLFALDKDAATGQLLDKLSYAIAGRAKPATHPAFPADPENTKDARLDGVTPPVHRRDAVAPSFPNEVHQEDRPTFELGDVFISTQIPGVTFVQQELFIPFKMKLRQPGLSVIVEGAAGLGKTTLLKHAIEQDEARFKKISFLSAREQADVAQIRRITDHGHDGLAVIDDFHRLPDDLKTRVVDYLKMLADQSAAMKPRAGSHAPKVVIAGIPDTARTLVALSPDIAKRIYVQEPKPASRLELTALIELGERALNIEFDDRQAIVEMASGSLALAQELCWWLAMLNGVEGTVRRARTIRTDIEEAASYVHEELRRSFSDPVAEFASLDGEDETICVDLLQALAQSPDGAVALDRYKKDHPHRERAVDKIFVDRVVDRLATSPAIARILYYDAMGRRLVADDPQFWFYLRRLSPKRLLGDTGKRWS
ncbi:TIR domain-containing protein [Frankia tisae]|uniref:TIR domain-containing protein n=1 Tax=Frankia tisae TaxID=2950104 RepID=UPI0021BF6AD5|nr:TIR domain-containing protein [Frankia tisae]